MPDSDPKLGDVYYYPYIWDRQPTGTDPEKDRPCCVCVRLSAAVNGVDTYLLAISGSGFPQGGHAIMLPKSEVERLRGFDANLPYWLTTSEYNATLCTDHHFSSMEYRGTLSNGFLRQSVLPAIKAMILMAFEKQKAGR